MTHIPYAARVSFELSSLLNILVIHHLGAITHICHVYWPCAFYAFAFRRRRHYVFWLSVRPSVRPSVHPSEARNTLFPPEHGAVVTSDQPWPFYGMSFCPERFLGFYQRKHGGNRLKLCMLMYLDHLQNWVVYDYGLLIILILALFLLSETGQICGFRAIPG